MQKCATVAILQEEEMNEYLRGVMSSLVRLVVEGMIAGIVSFLIGLVMGIIFVDGWLFRFVTGITCAIIGAGYVVWEREPPRA
jgi:hypothetical protein